jgi:thioredoxin-like negative regulator of GroEL
VLRKAVALAPDDQEILFHLSKALIETGRPTAAQPILARFRKAKDSPAPVAREDAGIIDAATK